MENTSAQSRAEQCLGAEGDAGTHPIDRSMLARSSLAQVLEKHRRNVVSVRASRSSERELVALGMVIHIKSHNSKLINI